jgi:cyclophilin family peptidyl-prolyl cis-trans isomerase
MLVRYCLVAILAWGVVAAVRSISAEDAAPAATGAAPVAAPSASDVTAEWTGLVKDMETFKEAMTALNLRFSKGTAAEKTKLVKEANELIRTFETKTHPRMRELAPQVYKLDPQNSVAAQLMLESLMDKNQYAELVNVSDSVLKKEPKAQLAANFNGVGRYAEHDFEGAVKVLKVAETDGILIPQLGGKYLTDAEQYIEFWKTEQAIRAKEDAAVGDEQLPIVKLSTSKGDIEILMLENEAPNAVANFISLTEKKFYDGVKFHRVIPGFMAQGGDPNSRDKPELAGQGGPGHTIACECHQENARRHFAGSLSMAHAGKDTGGSQFFLTHLPTSHLNGVHTVFGRAIKGLDVIRALAVDDVIQSAVVVRKRNHEYTPKTQPDKK